MVFATWLRASSLFSILLLTSACNTPQKLPTYCPEALQPPVPVPPEAPAWQRSGRSSLELSLRAPYIRAVITARIRTLLDSTGNFVPELQSVALEEKQRSGKRINLVKVRFMVLLKNQDGTTTALPGRNYTLFVELYPQLITPDTMPDSNLRKTLLQCGTDASCGDNGVILNFYFSELQGGPNFSGRKIDCHDSSYDVIDQGVLTGAYQIGGVWAPIPVPLHGVLQFVTDMTNVSAKVV